MKRYALFIWELDGSIHIYDLGTNNFDRACLTARSFMKSNHKGFVQDDNPNWQVGEFSGFNFHVIEDDN